MSFGAPLPSQDDWRYPSPSSTPRSDKTNAFGFSDPFLASPSTSNSTNLHWNAVIQGQAGLNLDSSTVPQQNMSSQVQIAQAQKKSNKQRPQIPRGQSVTESFIGKFDGTSLQDPATTVWQAPDGAPQMQTPPPTRDTSVKRRGAHDPVNFTTPSTIRSRRFSTALSEEWLRRSSDQAPLDASPLQFTPLQFSPADMSGPMTAPVQTDSAILWDPESRSNALFSSYSAGQDDPFFSSSPVRSDQWPSERSDKKFKNALAKNETLSRHSKLGPASARRSSVFQLPAAPASSSESTQAIAGVDPSILWSFQGAGDGQLKISDPPSSMMAGAGGKIPYKYHIDELRRERERRASGSKIRGLDRLPIPSGSTMPALRRSMTDSRARRSLHDGLFDGVSERQELSSSIGTIPRHASPLKRQRTGASTEQSSPTPRRSVTLTVDSQGRARTVVTPLGDPFQNNLLGASFLDDGSESSEDLLLSGQSSSTAKDTAGRNDAQDALRDLLQERRQKKRAPQTRPKRPAAKDSFAFDDGLAFDRPVSQLKSAAELQSKTHCVCLNDAASNYMIQCDTCKSWLHLDCLSLTPEQAPPIYICGFCQIAAGGHAGIGGA